MPRGFIFPTAETFYPGVPDRPDLPVAARAPFLGGRRGVPTGASPAIFAEAEVNHGRWIVRCPFCPGAQYASRTDPRFLCVDCGNAPIEGDWIRVEWPVRPDAIEAALALRPQFANMNWLPTESLTDLQRENAEHGL
jgi:hypothetical protein